MYENFKHHLQKADLNPLVYFQSFGIKKLLVLLLTSIIFHNQNGKQKLFLNRYKNRDLKLPSGRYSNGVTITYSSWHYKMFFLKPFIPVVNYTLCNHISNSFQDIKLSCKGKTYRALLIESKISLPSISFSYYTSIIDHPLSLFEFIYANIISTYSVPGILWYTGDKKMKNIQSLFWGWRGGGITFHQR